MSEHTIIDICVEPIELCKLLKIANMVGGGGEAKTMISEGNVLVNNEVSVQKRKKIRRGDIIEYNGKIIEVAYNPTKKSAEFISSVVSVTQNLKKKKRARSKAPVIASQPVTKPSSERSKRKPTAL
ncbi:RNA-binding S4 domain-containing protein [Colwellia hornerae]|uniref:RNA-binding S4 domain-containing protein n=1 Tax=Colwellia hornerae TaxID=89402 RepID=A0A5C6Q2F6_9GAMM|nr:RNA-binding S4 domain-containing protein [Colwellia hornerae]TWX45849.1 RNA-binding S4 domain-containing protein [Colwellia hornerae]TWX53895.1 RNA-binding S4 domain-containing protein [Colwellia hornerae]TWX63013.1 RNA-binding S4 domain-containing protein [Colwellia hornerae]